MCGIVGGMGVSEGQVVEALERIRHRGPDGQGVVLSRNSGAVLGHCRLAIRDLDHGAQPMMRGGTVVTWAGELWNYESLRAELGDDFGWDGHCDTEVVAAALDAWGFDALEKFEGQYAVAWTGPDGTFIARDPMGELPLYFVQDGMLGSMWASERKALPDHLRGQERPVLPGEVVHIETGVSVGVYDYRDRGSSWGSDSLLAVLRAAVHKRLVSDVPVGVSLSGGLDSTLILALVLEELKDVKAFTAVMDPRSSDLEAARQVAEEFGVELVEVPVPEPGDVAIRKTIGTIEIASKAQVEIGWPTIKLAQGMAAEGIKVALSGEGADELFGGYGNMAINARSDRRWLEIKEEALRKQGRGNFIRVNKAFMAASIEGRLPFADQDVIQTVHKLGLRESPPHKALLKDAARGVIPDWVIDREKKTFQGAIGMISRCAALYESPIKSYNAMAKEQFNVLPRG